MADNQGARHTIVFSAALFHLVKAWAAAERRTVGSVLTFALETGLRTLMQRDQIPCSAIRAYEVFCDKLPEELPND
jgi:hypothetical protein